jgi:dephospho-CoA kinase
MQATSQKLVVGLIGGIGSGKTAVAAEFARFGALTISGDELGHEALRQPDIRAKVLERFGAGIARVCGEVDRRKLGAIVFADVNKLRDLEKLVFPWIGCRLGELVATAQRDPAVHLIVVDAAVMVEAGWDKHCDKVIYVDVPRVQRLERLALQRGWTEQQVEARSRAQLPLDVKASRADAVIDNSGPPAALGPQIAQILERWSFPVAKGSGFLDNN